MNKIKKRIRRGLFSMALVMALVLGSTNWQLFTLAANENIGKTIVFTGDQKIRDNPGTENTTVTGYGSIGDKATILDVTYVPSSKKDWYYISLQKNGVTGWTSSQNVKIVDDGSSSGGAVSATTVAQYVAAGFPESYATKLAALSAKYPNWKFEAVNTGLDWNTVIEKESALGKNLVYKTDNDSHKSVVTGAYDWYKNEWSTYDGTGWVAASSEYIAYRMDPRNYLDESHIFAFESLSFDSNQTLEGVQAIVNGTFMSGSVKDQDGSNLNYAQAFYDLGKSLNISPYHLAARVYQEQGQGNSELISGTYKGYEGYFNYFNVGAFNTSSGSAVLNGLIRAKNEGWNTRYKSIQGGSSLLASSYISKGQDTLYFEKFNVINKSALFSHQYMSNVTAALTEAVKVANGYADKSQAFVFKIPIYNNMPVEAISFTDSGNPNNYLASITINGVAFTPAFNGATTTYSAVVGESVSSISVNASSVVGTSSVSGTGSYNLVTGDNVIKIVCKAQNGNERTYTITVNRQGTGGETDNKYEITSSECAIGSYVTGIQPGTGVSDLINKISATNCNVKVLNSDGTENVGTVSTGNKLAVYVNGVLTQTVDIIIYGDINGDGKFSMSDLVNLNRNLLGLTSLSPLQVLAGDVNHDGKTSMADLVIMNRTSLGLTSYQQ